MFEISDLAAGQIKHSAEQLNEEDLRLRISARRTEDKRITYKMGFDNFYDNDIKVEVNGIKVIFDPDTKSLIKGMLIDYQKLDGQEQLVFLNPNDPAGDDNTEK